MNGMADTADKPSVLELKLPEIEGRSPYTPPTSHLVKAGANAWGTRDGRRASKTMLATGIRKAVDAWRSAGYPGASEVSGPPTTALTASRHGPASQPAGLP